MISYQDAREGAEWVRNWLDKGELNQHVHHQTRLRYPEANGFEVNRIVRRGREARNIQVALRLGGTPFRLTLPYPYPPSSGPEILPNDIRLVVTVVITSTNIPPDFQPKHRQIVVDRVSGTRYREYLIEIDRIIQFWKLLYPLALITITDPARYIY